MNWLAWTIIFIFVFGFACVMGILKAGSDADDQLLGDRQYDED